MTDQEMNKLRLEKKKVSLPSLKKKKLMKTSKNGTLFREK